MNLKILEFKHREDFGDEWQLILLRGRNNSFLQVSVDWDVYASGPYLQMSSGYGRVLSILFVLGKFGLSFDLLGHNWPND